MAIGKMTERQVTKAYFENKITLTCYKKRLQEIATRRHAKMISKLKDRRSMSASKWR